MTDPNRGETHAVVVGSGIAGLTVALHAVDSGCRVTLVTKDVLEHANTRFAQGGIAGVMFEDDRLEDHMRDTLTAGAGLSDPEAVRVLVEEGPARIRELQIDAQLLKPFARVWAHPGELANSKWCEVYLDDLSYTVSVEANGR